MGYKMQARVYTEIPAYKDKLCPGGTKVTEQAVLAALAYKCNDETLECWPGEDLIAQMTHVADKTVVSRQIGALKRKGFLTVWKNKSPIKIKANGKEFTPRFSHNNYYFHFPNDAEKQVVKTDVSCSSVNNELIQDQPNKNPKSSQAEINEAWERAFTSLSLHRLNDTRIKSVKDRFLDLLGPATQKDPMFALRFVDVMSKWTKALDSDLFNDPDRLAEDLIRQVESITGQQQSSEPGTIAI